MACNRDKEIKEDRREYESSSIALNDVFERVASFAVDPSCCLSRAQIAADGRRVKRYLKELEDGE